MPRVQSTFSRSASCIPSRRLFGSTTRVTRVSLTDMRNINNPALQAERFVLLSDKSNLFYQGHTGLVRAPSDVSSFVLTAISNENRELSHTTPEAAKSTPEAATLATLVLPINWRVVLPNTLQEILWAVSVLGGDMAHPADHNQP